VGWGKGNIISCGAFCKAKYKFRRRPKRGRGGRGVWGEFRLARAKAKRQNSAFGFSLKKVRISFSVRSQIVCCEFIASALRASAGRLYSICQDFLGSIATFCESKKRFAVAKQRANESLRANPFTSAEGGKQSDNFFPKSDIQIIFQNL